MKEFAPACDRNSQVILDILLAVLADSRHVLEIGSGTGQHAVYFAEALPHLQWQASNKESIESINAWREQSGLDNLSPPVSLDLLLPLDAQLNGIDEIDSIVSINAIHIMPWAGVENLFELAGKVISTGGVIYVYGPYRYSGKALESSNENFDRWLKERDSQSGIRDFEKVDEQAKKAGFELAGDVTMPANNRSIWWQRI